MKNFYKRISILFFIILLSLNQSLPQDRLTSIVDQVNIDSLMHFVKELSGNISTTINGQTYTIASRHKNAPGNDMAMTYIQQKMQSYGYQATIQTFSTTGKNVYATKVGTDYPNKKYIICAHFDAMPSGALAPGADDNGSGTAAVIEAARIMKDISFPYTLVFALWDEEEQGLIGSKYYADQAFAAGDSIMGVVNMDMIAFDSNNDGKADVHTRSVGSSIQLWQRMVSLNGQLSLGLSLTTRNPGSTYSDHASFWNRGYGSILLIESDGDFHTQYHTVNDVISYFNIPYFHKMSKLAIATFSSFALDQNMSITHTPVASTDLPADVNVPIIINTGMTLGTGIAAPSLYYRTNIGNGFSSFTRVTGNPSDGSFAYNFIIPAQPLGTIVQYYIAAQDQAGLFVMTMPEGGGGYSPPGNVAPSNFYQFFIASGFVAMSDSAANTANWTSVQGWGLASNKFVSAPYSFTDSPTGNYAASVTSSFTYNPVIDLSNILAANLEFDTQWDIEADYDYGQVQISTNNGSTWIALPGKFTNMASGSFQPTGQPVYDGIQSTWVRETIDLTSYKGQQIKLRFYFRTDNAVQKDGWYIDNIIVNKYSVVPVELAAFNASSEGNKVLVQWTTSTELNNRGFELERSDDLLAWRRLAFINGAGTTTALNTYMYEDTPPEYKNYYYRLVQLDYDGTKNISDLIEVDLSKDLIFSLDQNYPNPFNPDTKIRYQLPANNGNETHVSLVVYDLLGTEVMVLVNEFQKGGVYEKEFLATGFASGVYFYRLKAGEFISTKKLILQK